MKTVKLVSGGKIMSFSDGKAASLVKQGIAEYWGKKIKIKPTRTYPTRQMRPQE